MIRTLSKILAIFTREEKGKILFLLMGILLMGLIEVIAVASILPFMMLVTNQQIIQTHPLLSSIFHTIGFSSNNSFLLFLGGGVFITIVMGNLFSAFITWKTISFSFHQGRILSNRLFQHYLSKEYEFFILNHSTELVKNILHEVNRFVTGLLLPLMQMLVKGAVAVFIIAMLFYVDPVLAAMITLVLGSIYISIYMYIKNRLGIWGYKASELHGKRFKVISEAFDGIKELKVRDKQDYFLKLLDCYSSPLAEVESKQLNAPQSARYILEAIAFGGILLVVLYLTFLKKDTGTMIPLLALYAFSGYRLMPALQQIFSGLSLAKYNYNALSIISSELGNCAQAESVSIKSKRAPISFRKSIILNNINYYYPNSKQPALRNVSIKISKNSLIGFVGKTGSGKSTLAYILIGLLRPRSGQYLLDDREIEIQEIKHLQGIIGYVPQNIFLTDDSILKNIAFGIDANEVNIEAVARAAKMANIDEFVNQLPEKYETKVGEKGVKLSGGQRQRIGIARALYHQPNILIFDEATSALDTITEKSVLTEIASLSSSITVIMIAHRLITVKSCDDIYLFENGEVITHGRYEELIEKSSIFEEMTRA